MSKTGDNLKASLKEAITIEKVLKENSALKAEISRLEADITRLKLFIEIRDKKIALLQAKGGE